MPPVLLFSGDSSNKKSLLAGGGASRVRPSSGMPTKHPALSALGDHIRKLREAKDFTQEEFAHQAGLERTYYGDVERGTRNVAALNLVRIARALGVEVGDLFPPVKKLPK